MNGENNQEDLNQTEMVELTENSDQGESRRRDSKKTKIFRWTNERRLKFVEALQYLGPSSRSPKEIQEFMNEPCLERKHVASHLQKYRLKMKKFEEAKASYIGPQSSYYSKSLNQENLSESHPSYGIGQSSSLVVKNIEYRNHMYYGQKPIYDVSQAGSNLVPTAGENFRFSSGVLPIDEAGRCNTQISLNSNTPLPLNSRNNELESCKWTRPKGPDRRIVSGTSQLSQVPRLGQSYAPMNVLGLNSDHDIGYEPSNGNGSLGESCGDMYWNLKNNNMYNHGSSTATFPSTADNKGQSQSSVVAQTNGPDRRIVLDTSQLSEVPRLGQSDEPMNVLGVNPNLRSGYEPSNGNDLLSESWGDIYWNLSDHGISTESFPSTVATFLDNEGQSQGNVVAQTGGLAPRDVFGTPQVSQVPLYGQHITKNNVLDLNPGHSTDYIHNNYTGLNTNEHGHFAGNGNVSHGQNYVGTMNSNFDNSNMMSNLGCSTSRFTSPYQSQSNLNAQINDLVHVPQNPSMPSDHQGLDQIFNNTINSQFDQNNNDNLESDAITKWSFDDVNANTSAEMLNNDNLERNAIPNWSFDDVNENTSGEMLNSVASNSGMYVPTPNMNTMNQVQQGAEDLEELPLGPLPVDSDFFEGDHLKYFLD